MADNEHVALGVLRKWFAFFRPVSGWKERLINFKSGQTTWEIAGNPELPKLIPFPLEWVPHRLELTDEDDEAAHARGFVFLPGTCVDSGKECEPGVVVSCLRCSVPLHPTAANMFGGFDPPYCHRCKWVLKLVF
jgi:hypothetical protein